MACVDGWSINMSRHAPTKRRPIAKRNQLPIINLIKQTSDHVANRGHETMQQHNETIHSRKETIHSRKETIHSRKETIHSREETDHPRKETMHSRKETIQHTHRSIHSHNETDQERARGATTPPHGCQWRGHKSTCVFVIGRPSRKM